MCFSADDITRYLDGLVQSGPHLPVWVGIPGPVSTGKLVAMAARLGVGRSIRLARGTGMARALWNRQHLLQYDSVGLAGKVHRRVAGHPLFAGFHIYTFNDFAGLPGLLERLPAAPTPAAENLDNGMPLT
jgi:methylenetetrahydrofolate reductase (NADPH)